MYFNLKKICSKLSEGSIIYEHTCFPFAVGEFGYKWLLSVTGTSR